MGPIADNPQRAIELSRMIETLAADKKCCKLSWKVRESGRVAVNL